MELCKWVRAGICSLIRPGTSFVSGVWLGQLVSSPNQADKWLSPSPFSGLPFLAMVGSHPNHCLAVSSVLHQIGIESFKVATFTVHLLIERNIRIKGVWASKTPAPHALVLRHVFRKALVIQVSMQAEGWAANSPVCIGCLLLEVRWDAAAQLSASQPQHR